MQTLKGKWWAKTIAVLLCVTSFMTAGIGLAGMIYEANTESGEMLDNLYGKISDNYSAKILNDYIYGDMDAAQLEKMIQKEVDPKMQLAIVKSSEREGDDAARTADKIGALDGSAEYVYGTPEIVKQATHVFMGGDNFTFRFDTSTLTGMANLGYAWEQPSDNGYETVERVWYVKETGLFYYETESGFYPVHSVCITGEEATEFYTLTEITEADIEITDIDSGTPVDSNGMEAATDQEPTNEEIALQDGTLQYRNDVDDQPNDPSNWKYVQLENEQCAVRFLTEDPEVVNDQPGNYVYVVENMDELQSGDTGIVHGYEETYVSDCLLYTGNTTGDEPGAYYYVFSYVDESISSAGFPEFYSEAKGWVDFADQYGKYAIAIELLSVIVFVLSLLFLFCAAGHRTGDDEIHMTALDKIWYEALSGIVFLVDAFFIALMVFAVESDGIFNVAGFVTVEAELIAAILLVTLFFVLSTVTRIKAQKFWRYTLAYWCWRAVRHVWRKIWAVPASLLQSLKERRKENKAFYREHMSLFWRTIVALCVASLVILISFAVMCVAGYDSELYVLWLLIVFILLWGVTLTLVMQMTKLQEGGRRIAEGDLSTPIDTRGMYGDFKEHAENINQAGIGIAHAVDKQMRSERFKTELITNVSHDIKTPLTSIINYVDLIKKEEIHDEKLEEYINVLDRQSGRLKKLIEDLIEASKASTGNLSVNFENCDARVLLTQIVGEFEEKTAANQLEMIVESPDRPVNVRVDSRHIWRVFDNLLGNICKYAQPGTRVYITLVQKDQSAVICFKNISRYQLNISNEELLERFVRGDSSRNTEGSGLGLSIAQSLTELMNGKMELAVDGDLFKVTLTFPVCTDK